MTTEQFLELRRKLIHNEFKNMNDRQFEAVTTTEGAVLVLAGAGSGKTTVLVNRIACMVKFGDAYNSDDAFFGDQDLAAANEYINGESDYLPRSFSVNPVRPWNILAITFTNKAASELKTRIADRLGEAATDIWAGTFHSVCGKILRRFGGSLGYTSHFTIYDTDDTRRVMKDIVKEHNLDDKIFSPKMVLGAISAAKDSLITPEEYKKEAAGDYKKETIALLYAEYSKRLYAADAMDFDDMIVNTVRLLQTDKDAAAYYGDKFRYIMVDEYQDTNYAQYVLVKTMAKSGNLCVVGDDDQSIYRFRGATIENILNFESQFSGAKTIRLEQNYRSTTNILDAANAVIANNKGRKGKTLWTANGVGELISVYSAADQQDEAAFVAENVLREVREGNSFSNQAVLYRMNAQSNAIENVFARSGISYKVVGGLRFFDRKEVKDVLAYLQIINNPKDDLRLKRVINTPKRGIGDSTVKKAEEIAATLGLSLFEVLSNAQNYAALSRSANKLSEFTNLVKYLGEQADFLSMHELFELLLDKSGYETALLLEGNEGRDRLENVKELATSIIEYEAENEEPTLAGFLEEVALVSDIDSVEENNDSVLLMTVHSAKGLEFDTVYLVGWEDGVFPGNQSIYAGPSEMEEERRLAYVAITRAKRKLFITNAFVRMLYGMTSRNAESRFLKEIPPELCAFSSNKPQYASVRVEVERPAKQSTTGYFGGYSAAYSAPKPKTESSYTVGMTVEHNTFGIGVIQKTIPMGSDTLLEIQFQKAGLKKLMAGFAKLKII